MTDLQTIINEAYERTRWNHTAQCRNSEKTL